MEITKLFFITYFAALLGVLPPGLVNMSVAKTCVHRGMRNGVLVAIGASVVVMLQAFFAVLLARYIFSNEAVRNTLFRTGIVIFGILAVYFFIKAKKNKVKDVKIPKHSGRRSFWKGVFVATINVLPLPYFCAISAALNITSKGQAGILEVGLFVLAAAAGTFTSLYVYVVGFNRIQHEPRNFAKYSNYFMAGLMIILVLITLFRM
ncbi:LysE family translocator [Leeuwenhoekiella parthenopeia]|uniref:LysE family translocator n=1 Tax=Leeuwenhoekiella parthenopeia TaxID=2890320 RepID=A0ABS8GR76_9FLAO|nr:LysE family transporter [Leeuwenhoekiella parthenopeia]MCC4211651.1 LysE family translocator [Leeuwenhoekiella parthenopeia]